MTKNQNDFQRNKLEEGKLRETERSNRAKEKLERRGQNLKFVTDASKVVGSINDPSWYNQDRQAVSDAANLSYFTPVGARLPAHVLTNEAFAGIMSISYTPTIGCVKDDYGPSDVAAQNLYAFVRYANSGASNYDVPDLFMYVLAVDNLLAMWQWGVRNYRIAINANKYNWYEPEALLQACGANASWLDNPANIRAQLNILAQRIAAFNVPANMPFFSRHLWLNANVFADSELRKRQYYVFKPSVYYIFSGTLFETGSGLEAEPFTESIANSETPLLVGATDYFKIMNSMVEGLLLEEDIGIMSGDILKAFGEDGVMKMGVVNDYEELTPVYSEEILSQISASTVCGKRVASGVNIWQTQDGHVVQGAIVSGSPTGPVFQALRAGSVQPTATSAITNARWRENAVINMMRDDVTPDDNMVASRLCATYGPDYISNANSGYSGSLTDGWYKVLYSCGTEVVNMIRIYYYSWDEEPKTLTYVSLSSEVYVSKTVQDATYPYLLKWAQFDWAPALRTITISSATTTAANLVTILGDDYVGDVANYAVVSEGTLLNMHRAAIFSLFGISLFGNRAKSRMKG